MTRKSDNTTAPYEIAFRQGGETEIVSDTLLGALRHLVRSVERQEIRWRGYAEIRNGDGTLVYLTLNKLGTLVKPEEPVATCDVDRTKVDPPGFKIEYTGHQGGYWRIWEGEAYRAKKRTVAQARDFAWQLWDER